MNKKSVPVSVHNNHKKWLRYYLDFCHKYYHRYADRESLKHFMVKLHEKHQSLASQAEATQAVSFITRCCKPFPHLPVNHPEHEAKGRPLEGFWPAKQFSDKLLNIEHCSVMRVLIYSIVDISVFLRASMPLVIKVLFSKLITPPELCISKGPVAWTMAETECCLNHLNP